MSSLNKSKGFLQSMALQSEKLEKKSIDVLKQESVPKDQNLKV